MHHLEKKIMTNEIESGKLFIKDVFNRWYRVPEYQRPYVWGTDQVSELLDDISQAQIMNPHSQYFLGSMVLQKKKRETLKAQLPITAKQSASTRKTYKLMLAAVMSK